MYRIGDTVTMTDEALDNYGEEYRELTLEVTHKATAYMPAAEFFDRGRPDGYHPGYDTGMSGQGLYDLRFIHDGEDFGSSLYDYELEPV